MRAGGSIEAQMSLSSSPHSVPEDKALAAKARRPSVHVAGDRTSDAHRNTKSSHASEGEALARTKSTAGTSGLLVSAYWQHRERLSDAWAFLVHCLW